MAENYKIEEETSIVRLASHAMENLAALMHNGNTKDEQLKNAFSALKRIKDLSQIRIDMKKWR